MYFFEKRPLGIVLCILLGGFSLFALFGTAIRWTLIGIASLLFLVFLLLKKKIGVFPLLTSIILLISFGLSWFYFLWYFPIYNRFPNKNEMEGKITSVVYSESFEVLLTVKTETIDSKSTTAKLLVSFIPDEKTNMNIEINDSIRFLGQIKMLQSSEFGFDDKEYYEARGVQGFVENAKNVSITKNSSFSILRFASKTREKLIQYIRSSADETTSGLLCALITGEKSELPGPLQLNFKRLGLSHILAVSGMHLAILTTGLHKILSIFTLDKKWRCMIAMLFVVFYMGITGFPLSVLRAGGMLLLSNLLFLFAKTRDSFTNLMLSVTAIFLVSPYAVRDTSLLLSFFATLGVLAALRIIEKIPYEISRPKKALIAIFSSLLTSFFAIAMTLPFSVFSFGRLSLVAPLTTLIFSVLVEILIYVGSIFLIIGAPSLLLPPIAWLAEKIAALSAYFSSFRSIYVLGQEFEVKLLCIIFYTLLISFLILKIKRKKAAFAVLIAVFLSVFVVGYLSTEDVLEEDRIIYLSDTENQETFLLIDDKSANAVVTSAKTPRDANIFLHLLDTEGILMLDNLWVSQYYGRTKDFLSVILSEIPICSILLPMPKSETELSILSEIEQVLKKYDCTYKTVAEGTSAKIASVKLHSIHRAPMEDGMRVMLSFQCDGEYYSYFSHGSISEQSMDTANHLMSFSRMLIFGCSGRKYNSDFYLEYASEHTDKIAFQTDDVFLSESVYEEYRSRVTFYYKENKISLLD